MYVEHYIYEPLVQEIMTYTDFDSIHKAMTALDWTWAKHKRVPSTSEIKQQALYMLNLAVEAIADGEYDYMMKTGGFEVRYRDGRLSLTFEIAGWDVNVRDRT